MNLTGKVAIVTGSGMAVNYGLNKVRSPAPDPVGSKIRLTATLTDVEEIKRGAQPGLTRKSVRDARPAVRRPAGE